jgi:hypothetical protein
MTGASCPWLHPRFQGIKPPGTPTPAESAFIRAGSASETLWLERPLDGTGRLDDLDHLVARSDQGQRGSCRRRSSLLRS